MLSNLQLGWRRRDDIVASIVNFFFWTKVRYAALAVYRRVSKKNSPER